MTKGLLNSINTKDRLYKMMVQTSTDSVMYEPLRANLKAYQRILKNSINEAKRVGETGETSDTFFDLSLKSIYFTP